MPRPFVARFAIGASKADADKRLWLLRYLARDLSNRRVARSHMIGFEQPNVSHRRIERMIFDLPMKTNAWRIACLIELQPPLADPVAAE